MARVRLGFVCLDLHFSSFLVFKNATTRKRLLKTSCAFGFCCFFVTRQMLLWGPSTNDDDVFGVELYYKRKQSQPGLRVKKKTDQPSRQQIITIIIIILFSS